MSDRAHDPAYSSPLDIHKGDDKGLTKRELFAAMAMQGLLAAHQSGGWRFAAGEMPFADWLAKNSVDAADALLAELERNS